MDKKYLMTELYKRMHPTLNSNFDIDKLTVKSNRKLWWVCNKGHHWESRVFSITAAIQNNRSGCPICGGNQVLAGFNDLMFVNPDIAAEWHPTKNGNLNPTQVTVGSNKKVWWQCKLGHEWEAVIVNRAHMNSAGKCLVCINRKVLAGFNDLVTTHPAIASEWHPIHNGVTKPVMVPAGYTKRVWWLGSCGHEWQASVANRVNKQSGCYYCAGHHLPSESKISAQLLLEFHPTKNGSLNLSTFTKGSEKSVWWLGLCGHEWKSNISLRATRGYGCPYCGGQKVLAGFNDLLSQNPRLAAEWHPTKNKILVHQTNKIAKGKVWWQCNKKHEWEAAVYARSAGNGCPECAVLRHSFISKPEKDLFEYFNNLGLTVVQSDRKILGNRQELDLVFPEHNVAVEFNGLYWHSELAGKSASYHYDKWLNCKGKGIDLVQVWEDDWNRDPTLVKELISHKLGIGDKINCGTEAVTVDRISSSEAEVFLTSWLLGEFVAGSHHVALKYEGAVVAVLSGSLSFGNTFMIQQFAAARLFSYDVGFGMLIDYVDRLLKPTTVLGFSDNAMSVASMYEAAGFVLDSEVAPSYNYVNKGVRSKVPEVGSEGYRIWGAGKMKYIKG